MSFNINDFKLNITIINAQTRVFRGKPDRNQINITTQACDHVWYRLVNFGTITVEGVTYDVGLHEMSPTEGGVFNYSADGRDIGFIDICPGESNTIKDVSVITESQDVTANGGTIVLVHRGAKILSPTGEEMSPMYILNDGETIHVDTNGGKVVAVLEFA